MNIGNLQKSPPKAVFNNFLISLSIFINPHPPDWFLSLDVFKCILLFVLLYLYFYSSLGGWTTSYILKKKLHAFSFFQVFGRIFILMNGSSILYKFLTLLIKHTVIFLELFTPFLNLWHVFFQCYSNIFKT